MKKQYLPWVLFSFFCFAVSLGIPPQAAFSDIPSLVFPIEQLRQAGRIISLFLLVILSYFTIRTPLYIFPLKILKSIQYLWLVQVVIFLKNLFEGNIIVALLLITTYTLFILVMSYGYTKWLYRDGFSTANFSIAMAGILFALINFYQLGNNPYPVTFINGQFSGTTNNPQMAALTLVSVVPCFMFIFEDQLITKGKKFLCGVGFLLILSLLWWTASRTGFLMAIATIIFFYRKRQGSLLRIGILMLFIGIISFPIIQAFNPINLDANTLTLIGKLQEGENTRIAVWVRLLKAFLDHPLIGIPLQGDRLGFGENSWLAVAATTGLVGLIPLLLFGFECLRTIAKMLTISRAMPSYHFQCSVVISGLLGLLVGSIAEAFLVGILSTPVTALLAFLLLADYIQKQYQYQLAYQTYYTANQFSATHTK